MAIIHQNGRRRGYHYLSMVVVFLVLPLWMLCSANPLFGSQQSEPQKILLLVSYQPSAPVGYLWNRGIQSILESGVPSNVDLDIEYLDVLHFKDAPYVQLQINLLRHKYTASQPDLVITVYNMAFDFMRTNGSDLFPGVPVVFAGVEKKFIDTGNLGPNITGVISVSNYAETLDLALRLHPDTQHVAVVSGAGKIGSMWSMNAMQAFQPYRDRVDFIDITGLPMPAILDKVASLPQRSLVMYITLLEDGAGNKFTATESASQISRVANAPVYSFWDLMLGHGIVGGYLSSAEEKGKAAAALALRILKGEQPSDIPLSIEGSLNAMFDWRELRRWSIKEDLLPLERIIKFKDLSTWERHQSRIIGGLVLIVLQGLIISYLLYQRRGRIRAERVLSGQLVFERFSAQLSSEFIGLPTDLTESKILESLAQVGALLEADRAYVFRFNWDKTRFIISHLWESNSMEPDQVLRGTIVKDFIPWVYEKLINGQEIIISDTEQLPSLEAFNEYEYCRQTGIRSFVIIPVQVADAPLCAIGLDVIQALRDWPVDIRDRLRLIGEIYANAIERQHSDKRAKATEGKFRTVADFTYDWEYWQNPDGSLQYVSPSCERISGYSAKEFMANPALLQDIIVPKDKAVWNEHRCSVPKEMQFDEVQFRIQRPDGTIRWIQHVCQTIFDRQGNNLGVRGSNRDVSKRESYKSETRQLQSELAHMDRIVTVSALTSALAHEINQPLAAMRSYAQAALRFMDKDQPEYDSVRKALQGIVADNKRAAAVVNRLRGLVKKETGHWEALEINSVINGAISLINSEIVMRKASIALNLHQSVPEVFGDSVQIQQVLINLLMNALDAMDDKPIEDRTITVSTRPENESSAFVSISDSGEGIPPEKIKTIFAPFQTTKSKGIGLGLAICKMILEAHGGKVWADCTPEGGAIFSLILPTIDQAK